MVQYAEECRALGLRYIFDPGQQCARMEGPELAAGLVGANIVICNDYEYELIREKTTLDVDALLEKSEAVIVTKGEHGSSIHLPGRLVDVPVAPERRVADPTGVGDAYRGGLMKGLALGADWETCGRLGSVAATYALEHVGGQSHAYSQDEFRERFVEAFGGTCPF